MMFHPLPPVFSSLYMEDYYSSSPPSQLADVLTELHRYIPSNKTDIPDCCHRGGGDICNNNNRVPVKTYYCDEFRMYNFKVRRCTRESPHEWVDCPYAHPGEKARRRDPRKFSYCATACTEFRKSEECKKGDSCEYAHGVFECWLHPDRYRTQPCKDGTSCRRRVCFFAHTADQLRLVSTHKTSPPPESNGSSYGGSPSRSTFLLSGSSPTSTLVSSSWPPMLQNSSIIGGLARQLGFTNAPSTQTKTSYMGWWGTWNGKGTTKDVDRIGGLSSSELSEEEWCNSVGSFVPPVPDVGWVSELVK